MRKSAVIMMTMALCAASAGCGAKQEATTAAATTAAPETTAAAGETTEAAEATTAAATTAAVEETTEAAEETTAEAGAEAQEATSFMSGDGWSVRYNPELVESREIDEHTAEFIYIGEAEGENKVTVSWVADQQPEEALAPVTEFWGDGMEIARTEGFFPGAEGMWGYWRTMAAKSHADGIDETAIAGEYNGGVLIFDVRTDPKDTEKSSRVSDVLAEVIDSVTYKEFAPQTLYEYYPGTYVSENPEGGSVILGEDHYGTLSFQDDIGIVWGTSEIIAEDGSFRYEFTIEGDSLMLNYDGEWRTFVKE